MKEKGILGFVAILTLGLTPMPSFSQQLGSEKNMPEQTARELTISGGLAACGLGGLSNENKEYNMPVKEIIGAISNSYSRLVVERYGSRIGASPKLTPDQIVNGFFIGINDLVINTCKDQLSKDDQDFIADTQKAVRKALKKNPKN